MEEFTDFHLKVAASDSHVVALANARPLQKAAEVVEDPPVTMPDRSLAGYFFFTERLVF